MNSKEASSLTLKWFLSNKNVMTFIQGISNGYEVKSENLYLYKINNSHNPKLNRYIGYDRNNNVWCTTDTLNSGLAFNKWTSSLVPEFVEGQGGFESFDMAEDVELFEINLNINEKEKNND